MLGSKIDLFGNEWLDVVFDQKNKSYGAYALRRQNNADTTKALLIAGTLFISVFIAPKVISVIKGNQPIDDVKTTTVTIQPPPVKKVDIVIPITEVSPPKSRTPRIEFPPPVVVADPKVDTDPVTLKQLATSDPGQKTIAGSDEGELVITTSAGTGPKQAEVVGDNNVYEPFMPLEVQPMFPGGMQKFYAYLSKAIRYPAAAQEIGLQGKVFVSFIIEKDGTLTDIRVEKKLGSGTDEEAIRVLKGSPRWIPGIQNAKPVRVKYNIPISFSLGQ